jgi:hypothetical protein
MKNFQKIIEEIMYYSQKKVSKTKKNFLPLAFFLYFYRESIVI